MKLFLALSFAVVFTLSFSQTVIKGKVTDAKQNPLLGSSVYLLNTLDGASADSNGNFQLTTSEKGDQLIVVSSIGYEQVKQQILIEGKTYELNFILNEVASELEEVVISAGTIEATNDRKVAVLRPLDIVTTAGAQGDIIGAIQTLPGTTRVGEQTGLFVRGGDATEASVIIDGMVVQNFFASDVPGVAQRSRFSPFQFKGTSFNSGGYSARYGQALSSILELNTNDMPTKETFNAGLSMAGLSLSGTKIVSNNSIEVTGNYTNVEPFYRLANTNFSFYKAPEGFSGSARWVYKKSDKSILKLLGSSGLYKSGTEVPDLNNIGNRFRFGLANHNNYLNASYQTVISAKVYSFSAISIANNSDKTEFGNIPSESKEWRMQARSEITYDIHESVSLLLGVELQRFNISRSYDSYIASFNETQSAAYAEVEWKPNRWFGIKSGIRGEHSLRLDQATVSPRVSAAVKVGAHSQISVASGLFNQNPNNRYLMNEGSLKSQRATHYIANYQWITEKQTFRVEAYYKSYNNLVRELTSSYSSNPYRFVSVPVNNSGNGYAQGVDLFWRDRKLSKNLDYWISYSFLDSKRLYETFPIEATPTFISNHNLNIVAKYFFEPLKINLAATYSYSSGRPYYNPTNSSFLSDRAPAFENLSINVSYVTSIKKAFVVFYLGVDNMLNKKNIFGYRYAADGSQRFPIQPAIYRSVFAGLNISLSPFNKDEL